MKHGVAFRKFSRTSSHRMLMLRNLVTSLIEHEQIKTTLPKARDTARLAEKIITLGKKGDLPAARRAQGFLLKHTLIPKVFGALAHRYAQRPGGYTRILKFGNRQGDNAPHAILELVDNPRDVKFNMTARALGWELVGNALKKGTHSVLTEGVAEVGEVIRREKQSEKPGFLQHGMGGRLRRVTQENLKKVLKYRGPSGVKDLTVKTQEYINQVIAEPISQDGVRAVFEENADKLKTRNADEIVSAYDSARQTRLRAGSRPVASEKSAFKSSSGAILRHSKIGLGLPGAGWYERQRAKLREKGSSRRVE